MEGFEERPCAVLLHKPTRSHTERQTDYLRRESLFQMRKPKLSQKRRTMKRLQVVPALAYVTQMGQTAEDERVKCSAFSERGMKDTKRQQFVEWRSCPYPWPYAKLETGFECPTALSLYVPLYEWFRHSWQEPSTFGFFWNILCVCVFLATARALVYGLSRTLLWQIRPWRGFWDCGKVPRQCWSRPLSGGTVWGSLPDF